MGRWEVGERGGGKGTGVTEHEACVYGELVALVSYYGPVHVDYS